MFNLLLTSGLTDILPEEVTEALTGNVVETLTEAVTDSSTGGKQTIIPNPEIPEVVLIGLGTVFAGIIVIILLCKLMSVVGLIGKKAEKKKTADVKSVEERPDPELAAVVGAAIAEEIGVEVSGIRIISMKKVK